MHEMQDMGVENKVAENHFYTAIYDIGWSKHEVMLEITRREEKSTLPWYIDEYPDDLPADYWNGVDCFGTGAF